MTEIPNEPPSAHSVDASHTMMWSLAAAVIVLPGIVAGLAVVLWSIVARPPEAGAART